MGNDLGVVIAQCGAVLGLGVAGGWLTWRRADLPPAFLGLFVWGCACAVSIATFWCWLIDPRLAVWGTRSVWVASVAVAGYAVSRRQVDRRLSLSCGAPVLAFVLFTIASVLINGAWPAGPAGRFTVPLPSDHILPRLLADRVEQAAGETGRLAASLDGNFLTSDRPPLQAAIVLAVRALAPSYVLETYVSIGILCQASMVLALWPVSVVLGHSRRDRAFILIGVCGSGFALLNTVYAWPKLLAAGLLLGGTCLLGLADGRGRASITRAISGGVLIGLALMAHGGAWFSVVALPVFLIAVTDRRDWLRPHTALNVAAAVTCAALVVAPWFAYQRYISPPGDRLLKMHLAGKDAVDPRPFTAVLFDQYRQRTPQELVEARVANVREQWLMPVAAPTWQAWLQWQQFFHLVPALDILALGLIAIGWASVRPARGTHGGRWARALFAHAAATWLFWILVMFVPHSALVHHGSYTMVLTLMALGALGLSRAGRLGSALLTVHAAVFVLAWVLPPGVAMATPRPAWLVAGVVALAATGLVVFLTPTDAGALAPRPWDAPSAT